CAGLLVCDTEPSDDSREVGPQVPQRLIFGLDQAPCMWQQHGAGRSQPHPPRITFEQLEAELALQRLDPLRECRLGQMQVLRGMSEMAGLGDFYESPELTQFHARHDYGPTHSVRSSCDCAARLCFARPYICTRDRA